MSNVIPIRRPPSGRTDDTAARIRAFLASMEPMADDLEDTEEYACGSAVIEQIAASSHEHGRS